MSTGGKPISWSLQRAWQYIRHYLFLLLISDCAPASRFPHWSRFLHLQQQLFFLTLLFLHLLPTHFSFLHVLFLLSCFIYFPLFSSSYWVTIFFYQLSLQKQALDKELDTLKEKLKWTEGQLKESQKKEAQTQAKLTVIHIQTHGCASDGLESKWVRVCMCQLFISWAGGGYWICTF